MMKQKFHSEITLDWLLAKYVYQPEPVPQARIVSLKDIENDYPELEKGKPLTKQEKAKMSKIKTEVALIKGKL
jgi:hypothetical protein